MFTRLTATVTISAPDASCALTITACDEYFPVPMMRRDENVLPEMEKVSMLVRPTLSATYEIDDLDLIALAHNAAVKRPTLEDDEAVLDGHAACCDRERSQQVTDRERTGKDEASAVQ